ncbi:domain of Kin17 curved DNA-binding protein-domain-containing protein [Globomyces pollinis-pini]|nr:domain of Kin17 curved DNA-binding protein-domain-containing protein [Globomyces pollinis-pini]
MGKNPLDHKSIRKKWKLKGLQKLKFYCQMCEKQCRDEHGFKCHCASESHLKQMMLFAQDTGKFIQKHSDEFHSEFMKLFSSRFRNGRYPANTIYQEFILDPEHVHLNSTKWLSLTAYIKYLGTEGYAKVEEGEKDFYITFIDRSHSTLEKQRAKVKRSLIEQTEEEKERKNLEDLVQLAKEQTKMEEQTFTELKRDENAPIKLSLNTIQPAKKLKLTKLSTLAKKAEDRSSQSESTPGVTSTKSTGLLNKPTGLLTRPTGLLNKPAGLLNKPTGLLNKPTGLLNKPTGLLNKPTGLLNQTAGSLNRRNESES